MSFTFSEPTNIRPAFNDLTFRVYETSYTQSQFKYNFYTYINDTLVNTSKLYPRPDGYCNFNPSHILQQYLAPNYLYNLSNWSEANTNEIVKCNIVFKYEHSGSGTTTEYTAATSSNKYTYLGVASEWNDAMNIPTFVANYLPSTSSTCEVLNYKWNGVSALDGIQLYSKDKRYISFFRKNLLGTAIAYEIMFIVKCKDGAFKQFSKNLLSPTVDAVSYINHFPIGITELNAITWDSTAIPAGKSSYITLTEDYGMEIRIRDIDGNTISKVYYYTFVDSNAWCKFDHYTIAYSTSNGSFGFINCDAKHFKSISIEKNIYNDILPYNYTRTDRVSTAYSSIAQGKIELNTTFMRFNEQIEEFIDMLKAKELYLIDKDNNITPVYIKSDDRKIPLIEQDGPQYFTFTVNEAFLKNTIK